MKFGTPTSGPTSVVRDHLFVTVLTDGDLQLILRRVGLFHSLLVDRLVHLQGKLNCFLVAKRCSGALKPSYSNLGSLVDDVCCYKRVTGASSHRRHSISLFAVLEKRA